MVRRSPPPAPGDAAGSRRLGTRMLMTCAAIAVACSVVLIGVNYLALAIGAALPLLYLALVGAWILGAVTAQTLLRRGGVGLLTNAIAGLVTALVSPYGWGAFAGIAFFGALSELPFVLDRYRRWPAWRFYAIAVAGAAAYSVPLYTAWNVGSLSTPARLVGIVMPTASYVAFTALGRWLAGRLRATGVGPQARVTAPAGHEQG